MSLRFCSQGPVFVDDMKFLVFYFLFFWCAFDSKAKFISCNRVRVLVQEIEIWIGDSFGMLEAGEIGSTRLR